jgi:hypothetical protein
MPKAKRLIPGATERQVLRAVIDAFKHFDVIPERQNTGGFMNPKGQYVKCGEPGNSDLRGELPAHFAPNNGKSWMCECKSESFDPRKCYGKARERFDRQLDRLRRLNEAGGYGFWSSDAAEVLQILGRIKEGWLVRIADDDVVELVEQEK